MSAPPPLSTLADAAPWYQVAHATDILSGISSLCSQGQTESIWTYQAIGQQLGQINITYATNRSQGCFWRQVMCPNILSYSVFIYKVTPNLFLAKEIWFYINQRTQMVLMRRRLCLSHASTFSYSEFQIFKAIFWISTKNKFKRVQV